jgi:beta-lactamase superfamily II metal-dependent hydrolase
MLHYNDFRELFMGDAIISVGRHNTFGHPGPTTLATLERAGVAIYRTDHCGAATISEARAISTKLQCRPLVILDR